MKKIRAITIREDQDKWLRDHRELNFSAFVQKKLDEEIDAHFHREAGSSQSTPRLTSQRIRPYWV